MQLPIISFSDLPPTQLNVQQQLQGLSLPPNCQHNPVMSLEYFLKIGREVEINVDSHCQRINSTEFCLEKSTLIEQH